MTVETSPGVDIERDTAASHMVTHIPRATADTSVCTIIQDVASLLIYFGLVSVLVI